MAVLVVGLGGAGHLLADGATPSPRALVLGALVVGLLSAAVASRRVPTWRLAAVVGVGQVVLHHAFSWAPGVHCVTPSDEAASVFATASVAAGGFATQAHACAGATAHQVLWSDPVMLLAHVLATVLVVVALRRGEASLRALCSWVGPMVLPEPVPATWSSGTSAYYAVATVPLGAPVKAADPVRGPPEPLALAA